MRCCQRDLKSFKGNSTFCCYILREKADRILYNGHNVVFRMPSQDLEITSEVISTSASMKVLKTDKKIRI